MHILDFGEGVLVPMMVFAIPIVAIVGGISAGIVRMVGQQRLIEMAQRERIAAIERGVDPSRLPPMPNLGGLGSDPGAAFVDPREFQRRRSMNLMVAGVVTLSAGLGLTAFLYFVAGGDQAWAVGLIPTAVGIGLLISAWLVRPQPNGATSHVS